MSHTSQQFYFKVPPLSLPILHPPHPSSFPPSFHPQPFAIHSPLTSPFCYSSHPHVSACLSVHLPGLSLLSRFRVDPFHLSPQRSLPLPAPTPPLGDGRSRPGGAAGLVRFMLREDGRLKAPAGISLCHQRLASTPPANVVGAAASLGLPPRE